MNYYQTLPNEIIVNNILTKLSIYDLLNLSKVDVRFSTLCREEKIWILKSKIEYPNTIKPKIFTWKEYYLCMRNISDILKSGFGINITINGNNIPDILEYIYVILRVKFKNFKNKSLPFKYHDVHNLIILYSRLIEIVSENHNLICPNHREFLININRNRLEAHKKRLNKNVNQNP